MILTLGHVADVVDGVRDRLVALIQAASRAGSAWRWDGGRDLGAYEAGATTREVGERFNLAHSCVTKMLKEQVVTVRRRSPDPTQVRRAIELYEAGLSTQAIAEDLGFGASTILRR